MKTKCEAIEGCKSKFRYTVTDHKLKNTVNLCGKHFKQGMKAFLEEDPIIRYLLHEGIL